MKHDGDTCEGKEILQTSEKPQDADNLTSAGCIEVRNLTP